MYIPASELKGLALDCGFTLVGLAKAEPVEETYQEHYRKWLEGRYHGDMDYLAKYLDERFNPRLLVPGTETILCVALCYRPAETLSEDGYQIAWYAYGQDYHTVVKESLNILLNKIQETYGPGVTGRAFTDTAPVLEKYWAQRAGLGWIGRHSQLVIPRMGSAFFLGELFLCCQTDYDTPQPNLCGSCHKCTDACPTQAILNSIQPAIDAKRCLSYLTIENRGAIPTWAKPHLHPYIYGCDRCLQACPHLAGCPPTQTSAFRPKPELLAMSPDDWHALTPETYQHLFKGAAVKRAKLDGLKRNIEACRK